MIDGVSICGCLGERLALKQMVAVSRGAPRCAGCVDNVGREGPVWMLREEEPVSGQCADVISLITKGQSDLGTFRLAQCFSNTL